MIQCGYRLVLVSKQASVGARVKHWLRLPMIYIMMQYTRCRKVAWLTLVISKKIKESRLLNAEGIGSEDNGESIVQSLHVLKIMRFKFIKAFVDNANKNLYDHMDTNGLQRIGKVPAASAWLHRVHEVYRRHDFHEAVRVRLGCTPTPARQSRNWPQGNG